MPNIAALFRSVAWVPVGALLLAWGLSVTPAFERLEVLALDAQLRLTARQHFFSDALVIDIDDPSLTAMQPFFGGWPYKRETYALLVDYLGEMGARAVVFDLVLSDAREGDETFRDSIRRNANVVLATAARLDAAPSDPPAYASLQGLTWQVPVGLRVESWPAVQPPLPKFTQPAPAYAHIGVVSAIPERDGILRRIPLFHRFDTHDLPAISLAAHFPTGPVPTVLLSPDSTVQMGPLSIPVDHDGALHLYYPANDNPVLSMPFSRVAQAALGVDGQTLDAATFRGKTVFVGSTAFFTDRVLTPVGEMKGVNVLALVHQSMAQGLLLKPGNGWGSGMLLLIALLPSAGLLVRPKRSLLPACMLGLGAALLIFGSHLALLYWLRQESVLLLPLLVVGLAMLLETVRTLRISNARRVTEMEALAHDDPLTGLPNRLSMQTQLAGLIDDASRLKGILAVILIDLDRFQTVNDTLSHDIGDQLLLEASHRLQHGLGANETVARLGGDEFAVMVGGADKAMAEECAQRMLAALNRPYPLAGQQLHVTASMGVSLYPHDGNDATSLLQNADTALNHAKAQGRSTYRFFTPELNHSVVAQMQIENQLHQAIVHNELVLYYQPQLDLVSGEVRAVEALIRWNHPDQGLLTPSEFIASAEKSNLILELDAWVLRTACQQMQAWQRAGFTKLRQMTVNLSARQFDLHDLPERVAQVLADTPLDATCLALELTESLAMKNPQHTVTVLNALKKMGVGLALDDFGTGHSSFSYLRRFPVNCVKVDQSFVRHIETDPYDADICSAMIALAHKLGLDTVAEGVETPGQLALLKRLGCGKAQGYLISHPLPAAEIDALLRRGESTPS